MSTPSWVVDDWYNEYWGHKYGESDFSTCTGHFTQVGRYSSWIAERQLLITANIRILQTKILCIFSACVERDEKGWLCYGWKVPLQRKKGQIQKGQVGISSVACWSLKVVFKKENGCSLSLQSSWQHIWKVQSERSCSKRWVFIVDECKIYFLRADANGSFFAFLSFCNVNVCKIYFPQGQCKSQIFCLSVFL